jgi:hypothetical protein
MSVSCEICCELTLKSDIKWLDCAHFLCKVCYGRLEKKECPFCRHPFEVVPKKKSNPERLIDEDIFEFEPEVRVRHKRGNRRNSHRSQTTVRIPMFVTSQRGGHSL